MSLIENQRKIKNNILAQVKTGKLTETEEKVAVGVGLGTAVAMLGLGVYKVVKGSVLTGVVLGGGAFVVAPVAALATAFALGGIDSDEKVVKDPKDTPVA